MAEFNEYEDLYAKALLDAQPGMIERYKELNPGWRQQELDVYVFGLVEMTSMAIRLHRSGRSRWD